ncbi:MAG: conjugal transfer protein TraN, partial [Holosporaceae bacterium]|nr:conjugal transfer protein TraN [Holosporaceae bacterium]
KSVNCQQDIPQFQDGFHIDQNETSKSFEYLQKNENARAVQDIHEERSIYMVDETEPFMERSENVHKDPNKHLEESDEVVGSSDKFTFEYCEECPEEEYMVTARKTKKRYVYLQAPPYITASNRCNNHGTLTVRVEVVDEPESIFREDGQFENIAFLHKTRNGATIDEHYRVNGVEIVLRKTIYQDGHPWIHPKCWMVPQLQNQVVNAQELIRDLLGGAENKSIHWGKLGTATLHHRIVNDTGEHYWILDDACQHYEELCRQELCRYHTMVEDPPTDKFWKGKKVRGSWGQTVTYACRAACKNTCQELKARGCSREANPECMERRSGQCLRWRWKFKCTDRVKVEGHKYPGKTAFCLGGDCVDSSFESDKDMIQALGYLSILEAARKEFDGTANIQIFKGKSHSCTRFPLSFKDCCGSRGWGEKLGLSNCDHDSKEVGKLRDQGKCVQIGSFCAEKINVGLAKFCLRKKTVYCCFGSKFAKLLQEQGKHQLGQNFGSPEQPNCRGFSAEELSRIDFSHLDLSEIIEEVMSNFKPIDEKRMSKHFATGSELERIRSNMKKSASRREGTYLQENMRHLSSFGGGKNE